MSTVVLEVYDRRWKKWREVVKTSPGVSSKIGNYGKKGFEIIYLFSNRLERYLIGKPIDPLTGKRFTPNLKDFRDSEIFDHLTPQVFEVPVGDPVRVLIRFKKQGNLQKVRITRIPSVLD